MTLIKIAALALVIGAIPTASFAQTPMSPEECTALMAKADKNADGSVGGDEAVPFAKAISDSETKPANEGVMTTEEFMGFCQQGLFSEVQVQ